MEGNCEQNLRKVAADEKAVYSTCDLRKRNAKYLQWEHQKNNFLNTLTTPIIWSFCTLLEYVRSQRARLLGRYSLVRLPRTKVEMMKTELWRDKPKYWVHFSCMWIHSRFIYYTSYLFYVYFFLAIYMVNTILY